MTRRAYISDTEFGESVRNALHQSSYPSSSSTRQLEGLNMKKLALALTATAVFAGQAMAADMPMKARPAPPPPPPVANWTGCYIAGSVGYGLFDNETTGIDATGALFTPGTVLTRSDFGGRGWLAGGGGGCDSQFGVGGRGPEFGTGRFLMRVL